MKGIWKKVVAAVLVLAVIVSIVIAYNYSSKNYVAKVSGQKIKVEEYKFFLNLIKFQMEGEADLTNADDEAKKNFWNDTIDGEKAIDNAKKKALEQAKEYKIQLIKAKENNIILSDTEKKQVEDTINSMMENYGGQAEFEKTLNNDLGISLNHYREISTKLSLIDKYKNSVLTNYSNEITLSDDEAKQYYEENKDLFDQVTVKHILFLTVDDTGNALPEDKQNEAKANAEDILKRVNAGEDMAELAKQYSEDPGSKDSGGEYTFGKGKMVPEFEDWAFSAKVGDTGIVKTSYGYHVMRLEAIQDSFEPVKESARTAAKRQKMEKQYTEQLESWKSESNFDLVYNTKVFDSITIN